eukprot:6193207-Pleurochrysis_carterae.AAC.1
MSKVNLCVRYCQIGPARHVNALQESASRSAIAMAASSTMKYTVRTAVAMVACLAASAEALRVGHISQPVTRMAGSRATPLMVASPPVKTEFEKASFDTSIEEVRLLIALAPLLFLLSCPPSARSAIACLLTRSS